MLMEDPMSNEQVRRTDLWASGEAYEPYVGRWSRLVGQEFLQWLNVPPGSRWLDVGCGTGVLSQTILDMVAPSQIKGIDRSEGYIAFAQNRIRDSRVTFQAGNAQSLPVDNNSYDVAVSGLMLNFVPEPGRAVQEMARSVILDGVVALYVWDYAGKMQLMRHFWNAAVALDPAILDLDEGRRSPICNPQALTEVFQAAGLKNIQVRAIDISTDFKDFDDYWSPFLGGQGPAPSYAMSLPEQQRTALRERIRAGLPFAVDGSIPLFARAWAIRGSR
jgi:SAM-dependent methyltransferase